MELGLLTEATCLKSLPLTVLPDTPARAKTSTAKARKIVSADATRGVRRPAPGTKKTSRTRRGKRTSEGGRRGASNDAESTRNSSRAKGREVGVARDFEPPSFWKLNEIKSEKLPASTEDGNYEDRRSLRKDRDFFLDAPKRITFPPKNPYDLFSWTRTKFEEEDKLVARLGRLRITDTESVFSLGRTNSAHRRIRRKVDGKMWKNEGIEGCSVAEETDESFVLRRSSTWQYRALVASPVDSDDESSDSSSTTWKLVSDESPSETRIGSEPRRSEKNRPKGRRNRESSFEKVHELPLAKRISSESERSSESTENNRSERKDESEGKRPRRSNWNGNYSLRFVSKVRYDVDWTEHEESRNESSLDVDGRRRSRRKSSNGSSLSSSSSSSSSFSLPSASSSPSAFAMEEESLEKEDDAPLGSDESLASKLAARKSQDSDVSESGGKQSSCSKRIKRTEWTEESGEEKKEMVEESRDRTKSGGQSVHRAKTTQREEEWQDVARRVTRGSKRSSKENFVGKLVWGFCGGWWPALIVDAEHVGMLSEAGKLWVYWIGEARISLLNEKTQIESFSSNLKCRLTQNSNVARCRAIDATMQMLRKRFGCTLTKPYSTWIENNFTELDEPPDEIKFYPYPARVQRRLDYLREKNAKTTEKYLLDQKRSPNRTKKSTEKSRESTGQANDVDLTRLPLKEQRAGVVTWAKIAGHNWWPAMIIDYRDCCMREPSFGCQWIMWYGDYKLSEIHHNAFLKFDKGMERMRDYVNHTKKHVYLVGVLQAAKDYCSRLGRAIDEWTLADAFEYFSKTSDSQGRPTSPPNLRGSIKIYDKYSPHIGKKLNELKNNPNIDDQRQEDIKDSEDLRSVVNGTIGLETLCLKCLKSFDGAPVMHPFFDGSLCKECSEQFKPCMFVYGNDGKCFYCTICAGSGTVIICDKEDCPRVYCTACMKHLLCPKTYDDVLLEDPWECFLCKGESAALSDTMIKPRPNWKDKIIDMFRTSSDSRSETAKDCAEKTRIRVLSLFDGLSTGLLVLRKLGLDVEVYYASEIDKDALMVSNSHFGDRIVHLGNVRSITKEKIKEIAPIDLLIGGSPCNDLSLANPARLGLYDPKGTGVLFFDYCRIMKLVKKANEGRRLFWLYENVASMPTEYRLEINKHLGQEPDVIDSADFSPQHRLRLYWHNLPIEPHSLAFQGEQDVQDILTPHCHRYALVKKIRTVTTKVNSLKQGKAALKPILMKDESDSLWITELEEIFGFPRHYTDVKNLSATKRQKLIGKSWSVQTLTAILRSLCPFFEREKDRTN